MTKKSIFIDLNLVKQVKFDKNTTQCSFQRNLSKQIQDLNSNTGVIVRGDKSSNLYNVEMGEYLKIMDKEITKNYKKVDDSVIDRINDNIEKYGILLGVDDRVSKIAPDGQVAFCNLKDHKSEWERTCPIRLINPCKSDLGKMSKKCLDRILGVLRKKFEHLNQFRSTDDALKWFRKNSEKASGILTFDIEAFYPSISEKILTNALDWAESVIGFEEYERGVIVAARDTVLIHQNSVWAKKGNSLFDVTMGCPDGAEIAELVGLYLLNEMKNDKILDPEMTGLYRDDGVALVNTRGRSGENLRQKIHGFFKKHGLGLEVSPISTFIDFLDVRFDVSQKTYQIYHKPNANTQYVHRKSNHPAKILNNMSNNTNLRINKLCSNEELFNKNKNFYENILQKSGYKSELKFQTDSPNFDKKSKKRTRKVIWYNPPFSLSIKTPIGKSFLKLLDTCFPKNSEYSKAYNRSTIKVSYCTMNNVKSVIKQHNNKILNQNHELPAKLCNCKKRSCPVGGMCLQKDVIYEALITENSGPNLGKQHSYIGLTSQTFKERYSKHLQTLKKKDSSNHTKLSDFAHKLGERNIQYDINWRIIERAKSYDGIQCRLCLGEKTKILFSKAENPLNQRSELLFKCRHRRKYEFSPSNGTASALSESAAAANSTTTQKTETQGTRSESFK
jgi:hypothetical protein